MRQTFTLSFKNLLLPLFLQLGLLLCVVVQGYGQDRVTVFAESMGTVPSTSVALHESENRFDNDGATMTGSGAVNETTPSSGYTGASGFNSVLVGGTNGYFRIDGINTSKFEDLELSFGIRKSASTATASDLILEYSTDGINWTSLEFELLPSATGWHFRQAQGEIPSVSSLSIRFQKTPTNFPYRIDDIVITGTYAPPIILSIDPTSGMVGETVTITGSGLNFGGAPTVTFHGGVVATSVVSNEDGTELEVVVPTGAQTGAITVSTAGGIFSSETFTIIEVIEGPSITGFTPTRGGIGTHITITGTQLQNVVEAFFWDDFSALEIISVDTLEVVVEVVEGYFEESQIVLYTNDGEEILSNGFFEFVTPTITSFTPIAGPVGTQVTILGENLETTYEVRFEGNIIVAPDEVEENGIGVVVRVPAGAQTGAIVLHTEIGNVSTPTNFTVEHPTITDFTPTEGPVGTAITIRGDNLLSTTTVRFTGGVNAEPTSTSNTEVVVNVPAGAQSGVLAVITAAGDTATSSQVFNVLRPTISGIFPTSQRVGQNITITGTRLNIERIQAVTFTGGAVATAVTGNADGTQLQVVVPAGAQSGVITVTTSEGTATSPAFTLVAPTITITGTLAPFSTVAGTASESQTYTVSAANLDNSLTITVPANFQIWRPTAQIWDVRRTITLGTNGNIANTTITIRYNPAAAGDHNGNITHVAGSTSANLAVTGSATPAVPSITEVTPSTSRIGQTIVITGTRLNAGTSGTEVTFNNILAGGPRVSGENIVIVSATELHVTIPASAASGSIIVTTSEGPATYNNFEVLRPDITLSTSQLTFKAMVGEASAAQPYTISAVNLAEGSNVTITAPTNFEVSLTGVDSFGPSVQLDQTNTAEGSLSPTTIYVRYFPTEEGSEEGNITNASTAESELLMVQGVATSLPVELVSFTAQQQGGATTLKWVTASETDNSHFEVEMSTSPETGFETLGTVKSKVVNSSITTRYEYTHQVRTAGTFYYRLKQVDLDGTYAYSNVVVVEAKGVATNSVMVAPNPLIPDSKIIVEAASSGKAVMRLTSMTGQQVYFREVEVVAGQNEFALPYYDKLQNAAYILTVELNGKLITTKVVKQ
ncbi:IPT/TIG domain-containing protein [Pontibacter sp. 13R65]|uniref:IPT/TIG domain-containing protein n=1 Tax=Pontibacter sp. 13R65 TaxID=3127458 RepID=UPI00301E4D9F